MNNKQLRKNVKSMLFSQHSKNQVVYFSFAVAIATSSAMVITRKFHALPIPINSNFAIEITVERPSNSITDAYQIESIVMKEMLVGTGSNLTPQIKRVTIVDNYAMADWLLGESAGSAILAKEKGAWTFLAPGGGVYKAEELQREFGIPENTAKKLIQERLQCIKHPSRCSGR